MTPLQSSPRSRVSSPTVAEVRGGVVSSTSVVVSPAMPNSTPWTAPAVSSLKRSSHAWPCQMTETSAVAAATCIQSACMAAMLACHAKDTLACVSAPTPSREKRSSSSVKSRTSVSSGMGWYGPGVSDPLTGMSMAAVENNITSPLGKVSRSSQVGSSPARMASSAAGKRITAPPPARAGRWRPGPCPARRARWAGRRCPCTGRAGWSARRRCRARR